MSLTFMVQMLVPIVVLQIIYGVYQMFKMWASLNEYRTLFTHEVGQLKEDVKELKEQLSVSRSDDRGFSSQLASINNSLGVMQGKMEMLVEQRRNG